jgi:hypothetical protein
VNTAKANSHNRPQLRSLASQQCKVDQPVIFELKQSLERHCEGRTGGAFLDPADGDTFYDHFFIKGLPARPQMMPLDLDFRNVQTGIPDLYQLEAGCIIVSTAMQEALRERFTGLIEYLPLQVKVSGNAAVEFYFVNVRPKARMIDWGSTPRRHTKTFDGTPVVSHDLAVGELVFKSPSAQTPAIWREDSFQEDGVLFRAPPTRIFFTKQVRDHFDRDFPGLVDRNMCIVAANS